MTLNMNISMTPNYSYYFPFESEFDNEKAKVWMNEHWHLSFYFVGLYLLAIFLGQYLLRNQKRFELRGYLVAWNALLSIFSSMGALRTAPELMHVLHHFGLSYTICKATNIESDQVAGFWSLLFALSKLPELGDTVFMVLRKQPLNFLHWYHHSTVLICSWYCYSTGSAMGRWFVVMNYSVHAVMYFYYAVRAARFKIPRICAMMITSVQLLQMLVGCAVNIQAHHFRKKQGFGECPIEGISVNAALVIYVTYFILFARLFYKSYIASGGEKKISFKRPIDLSKSKVN